MLRLAFDFIITWRETRTRPNAYPYSSLKAVGKLLGLVDPVKSATSAYISYHWNSERIRRA